MTKIWISMLAAIALAACGSNATGKQGKTGNNLKGAVGGSKSALTSKKPMMATRSMMTPKELPMAVAGMSMVQPDNPVVEDTNGGDESWEIAASDNIDLDGDSDGDAADVMLDDETGDLYVWWTGAVDFDGDGADDSYNAFAVIYADGSVLFIVEVGTAGGLACNADASGMGGCVVCDATECAEVDVNDDFDDEDTHEEDDPLFDDEHHMGDG